MNPIVLTKFDETLLEYPASCTTDEKPLVIGLSPCIGIHDVCKGWVDVKPVSKTYYVIFCRTCGRIGNPIPIEIDTFGKLRHWCKMCISHPGLPEHLKRKTLLLMEEIK